MLDIIIRNGKVIDGGGKNLPQTSDVGIKDGEIIRIGNLEKEVGAKEIDAKGKYVVPGFIDINNHSDTSWTLFRYPDQQSMVMQGVTTIIGGNCGSSLAPILGEGSIKSLRKWISLRDVQIDWDRMGEFLSYLEDYRSLRVNFGTLVGHATLRRGLIGDNIRALSPEEIKVICREIERAFQEGAWGLSTGLAYTHTRTANEKEITACAEVVKYNDGLLTSHLRGESEKLVSSVKEMVSVAQKTGVNLEISHLKAVGKKAWHLFARALSIINEAINAGANINFDVYPYTSSGPVLYTLLPDWVTEGGRENLLRILKDSKNRAKAVVEMKKDSLNYAQIVVASSPVSKLLVNKSITEIARMRSAEPYGTERGSDPEEVIVDLALASEDQCSVIVKLLAEKNVTMALKNSHAIISSDGIGYAKEEAASGNIVHPRCFGTFPRFLSYYVKQKKIMSLPKAVHKITGMPAAKIGLRGRGQIKEGYKADLVVIDWKTIVDEASINAPYNYPKGIQYVVVNGELSVEEEQLVEGVRSGKVLRKQ